MYLDLRIDLLALASTAASLSLAVSLFAAPKTPTIPPNTSFLAIPSTSSTGTPPNSPFSTSHLTMSQLPSPPPYRDMNFRSSSRLQDPLEQTTVLFLGTLFGPLPLPPLSPSLLGRNTGTTPPSESPIPSTPYQHHLTQNISIPGGRFLSRSYTFVDCNRKFCFLRSPTPSVGSHFWFKAHDDLLWLNCCLYFYPRRFPRLLL